MPSLCPVSVGRGVMNLLLNRCVLHSLRSRYLSTQHVENLTFQPWTDTGLN